jgi:hypothetical protein
MWNVEPDIPYSMFHIPYRLGARRDSRARVFDRQNPAENGDARRDSGAARRSLEPAD